MVYILHVHVHIPNYNLCHSTDNEEYCHQKLLCFRFVNFLQRVLHISTATASSSNKHTTSLYLTHGHLHFASCGEEVVLFQATEVDAQIRPHESQDSEVDAQRSQQVGMAVEDVALDYSTAHVVEINRYHM